MSASRLDAVYRSILITKFFTKGWGKPDNLRRLFEFRKIVSNREECYKLIPSDYPITITKEERRSDIHLLEGHFLTPMEIVLPGVVPKCAHRAHFQVVMPANWADADYKPMCVHLAGTGDHYFWRRRALMAKPLIKEAGIGAIILENPFYGLRKPEDQVRSSLHNVSDIFVMGGCLILETLALLHWCERNGLGPLGVTGLSMGGHMASLAATNWPKPLVLVPCLSWSTASAVFTQGVMSNSINWDLLETQFFSDGEYRDKLAKMVTIVDEAFLAGRKFAQQFSPDTINSSNKNYHLPAILNNNSDVNKKFDITNPNHLSSCQGLLPEKSQNYFINKTQKITDENNENNTSLEALKNNQEISDNLYKKITSDKKFELDFKEISELNELAFRSFESSTSIKTKCSENSNEDVTENIKCDDNKVDCDTNAEDVAEKYPKTNGNSENYEIDVKQSSMLVALKPSALQKLLPKIAKNNNDNEKNILNNLLSNIPFISKQKDVEVVKCRKREALQFMRGVMDECTHLGNFSVPVDTSLIIAVCAKNDAYVPRGDTGGLAECWPGAEIRYIDAGHVSAYVLHQSQFRSCIIEAFEKSKKKWCDEKNAV